MSFLGAGMLLLLAVFVLLPGMGVILYLIVCMPSFLLLGLAMLIPRRLRYLRIIAISTVNGLFFAPYIRDYEGIPTPTPIIWSTLDPNFSMQEHFWAVVIPGMVVYAVSAAWLLLRSNGSQNADARDESARAG